MTAEDLRKSILQQAIQGKLVPQDPNDEPASVLLERIREEKNRLIKEKKIKKDKNESIIYRGEDNSYYEKMLVTGEVKCIDDEIPFEIPQSWEWVRLKNIGITETGTTPSKSHPEYFGDYISFIGPGNIQKNKIISYSLGISKIGLKYCRCVPANSILQVCIGGSIGKAAITPKEIAFNQQINSISVYSNIEYSYIYYLIITDYFKKVMILRSTGTATPIINRNNWENIIIPLPPLSEQKRIVTRIEELMTIADKFEKAKIELDQLESELQPQLKKSILQYAIQGKLVAQDPIDEPASELLKRIEAEKEQLIKQGKIKRDKNTSVIFRGDDNKYYEKKGTEIVCIDEEIPFEIPDSWMWVRIKTACKITNGFTPLRSEDKFWKDGTINWFTVDDIHNQGEYIFSTQQKISIEATTNERIVRPGSVLLCCTASIGQCAMSKIPITTNQQFNALTVKEKYQSIINDDFLFLIAKTLKDELHRLSGTTTFEFVSVKKVGNILIPIPPIKEQQRITNKVEKILKGIED